MLILWNSANIYNKLLSLLLKLDFPYYLCNLYFCDYSAIVRSVYSIKTKRYAECPLELNQQNSDRKIKFKPFVLGPLLWEYLSETFKRYFMIQRFRHIIMITFRHLYFVLLCLHKSIVLLYCHLVSFLYNFYIT